MTISEYEKLRQLNIQRNEEFLRSIGVQHKEPQQHPVKSEKKKSKKRDFDEVQSPEEHAFNRRRSRRIQQLPAESDNIRNNDLYFKEEGNSSRPEKIKVEIPKIIDSEEGRRKVSAPQLSAFIQASNPDHFEALSNEVIVHTAYRMSYMSSGALATRLKAVAKAAKPKSHEKLLVFYYALTAANLTILANSAKEQLQRIGVLI